MKIALLILLILFAAVGLAMVGIIAWSCIDDFRSVRLIGKAARKENLTTDNNEVEEEDGVVFVAMSAREFKKLREGK